MAEKELDDLTDSFNRAKDSTDAWTAAQRESAAAAKKASEELRAAASGFGNSAKSLGSAVLSGTQNMSKYGAGLTQLTDATNTALKAFGPLGVVLGAITKAFGLMLGSVLKQNDALVSLNSEFSKTGQNLGLSSQRMLDMAHAAGFTVATMDQFQRAMGKLNNTTLTLGTTSARGAENFAQMNKITDATRRDFLKLGYSSEEIIDTFAEYARIQGAFGLSQGKTVDQLRVGAEKYTRTLSELTALTGESRDELQKRNAQAAADLKFQLTLRTEGRARADEFLKASQLAGSAGAGVRDFISGLGAAGDEGRKLMLSTGGAIEQLTAEFKRGEIDAATYNKRIAEAQQRTIEQMGPAFVYSREAAEQFGITAERLQEIDRIRAGDPAAAQQAVKDAQEQADSVRDLNATRIITEKNFQQGVDKMVNTIAGPVNSGLTKLAEVVNKAAEALGNFVDRVTSFFNFTQDKSHARAATQNGAVAAPTGVAGGTAVGAGSVAQQGTPTGSSNAPPGINLEDIIKFTGNTGSRQHFNRLDTSVQDSFTAMAAEYFKQTGKKLQINSSYRSAEEQASIDPGPNPRAAPGASMHQAGRAIDIQSEQVNALRELGLLDKYKFKTLANDPPHIYMRDGGVAKGPKSGYPATLHGTEAVVPLPDGKTIPVSIQDTSLFGNAVKDLIASGMPVSLKELDIFKQNNDQLNNMLGEVVKTQADTASLGDKFDQMISKLDNLSNITSQATDEPADNSNLLIDKFDQMISRLDDINSTQNEVLALTRASG